MKRFGKDKFRNCLRIILVDEMKKFGKDKFRNCLRILFVEWDEEFGKDKFRNCLRIILVEWDEEFGKDKFRNCLRIIQWWAFWFEIKMRAKRKRVSPRESRPINLREWLNKMRAYGVFIPSYGAIEGSSNRRVPEDSSVCCRIIWSARRGEAWRFIRVIAICG